MAEIAQLSPNPKFHVDDANGKPLAGGLVSTFIAGSSTPIVTYTDASGTIENETTVELNIRGEADIWLLTTEAYKFVITDADLNPIYTVDNITVGGTSAIASVAWSAITGKPTTFPPSAHNQAWSTITSRPTTIAGYGITNAYTKTEVDNLITGSESDITAQLVALSATDVVLGGRIDDLDASQLVQDGYITSLNASQIVQDGQIASLSATINALDFSGYLPTSGGTMTGELYVKSTPTAGYVNVQSYLDRGGIFIDSTSGINHINLVADNNYSRVECTNELGYAAIGAAEGDVPYFYAYNSTTYESANVKTDLIKITSGANDASLTPTDLKFNGVSIFDTFLTPGTFGYNHTQSSPNTTWTITHNLGYKPNVQAYNSSNDVINGTVHHVNTNQCTIVFSSSQSGGARCI
jgi:hypothetical protein